MTATSALTAFALTRQKMDFPPAARIAMASAAGGLFALSLYVFMRWFLGYSPPTPWVRDAALAMHLVTVIPALPLGAYVLLSKKGGSRHKLLGKIWLGLMLTTAIATLFIRNINHGQFSWIHLFTLLTFIAIPQAIISARQGKIEQHKKHLRNFFLGSLVIAGAFTFIPGRTMWQWAFGDPVAVQPSHG
ncbi:MAG: DUF2306 domain-containing protein [Sphingomonas sp.]|nr:DUF2306 domain-containing protein [Sphingomonas sp.]